MPAPLFAFFEAVADELFPAPSKVITREDMKGDDDSAAIFDDLKEAMEVASTSEAAAKAVEQLEAHFAARGSALPFTYDAATARFTVVDGPYLAFIREMKRIRGLGLHSRTFECQVAERLSLRATGGIHRVGHPRDTKKTQAQFNKHMKTLGFEGRVLYGQEKDGGLDILWKLPLGAVPHSPLVSLQCKNSVIDMKDAYASVTAGGISLGVHTGLQPGVHVSCVVFNDYIQRSRLSPKALNFVPLGLTDLAAPVAPAMVLELI